MSNRPHERPTSRTSNQPHERSTLWATNFTNNRLYEQSTLRVTDLMSGRSYERLTLSATDLMSDRSHKQPTPRVTDLASNRPHDGRIYKRPILCSERRECLPSAVLDRGSEPAEKYRGAITNLNRYKVALFILISHNEFSHDQVSTRDSFTTEPFTDKLLHVRVTYDRVPRTEILINEFLTTKSN